MALEVLTNEGVSALNTAIASGPRLVVEFAALCNQANLPANTLEGLADLKASDIPDIAAQEGSIATTMKCVAMLPSEVAIADGSGTEAEAAQLEPRYAVDCEFSWLPPESLEFDAVAIFARLYYPYPRYQPGSYTEGDIVWVEESGAYTYYLCLANVTVTSVGDGPDPLYWAPVTMTDLAIANNGDPLRASSGTESLVLLHVSTIDQPIKVGPGLEFNYKLRLFLNQAGIDVSDAEHFPIYLESLVPAGSAALQLGFLKEMAETMATMRSCIAKTYEA